MKLVGLVFFIALHACVVIGLAMNTKKTSHDFVRPLGPTLEWAWHWTWHLVGPLGGRGGAGEMYEQYHRLSINRPI